MKIAHSAGGVVLNTDGHVLVVNQNGDSWSLPKGHLDPGEDELQAAIREIEEESGINQLTLIQKIGQYTRHKLSKTGGDDVSETKVITLFLFTTTQMDLAPIDPHNPEARWVSKDTVSSYLTHPKDKEFFEKEVLPCISK